MNNIEQLENQHIKHLQLFFYLVPVLGFFPALWTLYRRQGNREQQAVSRLSVTLALAWLSGYILLAGGAQATELFTVRLLFINSLLTSGYFLVSLWLMVLIWQRKSLRLPGFSRFAERVVGRHLS
ncbi:MAG: hypothetical protein KME08_18170 [Aphanothece sp. CMT-3BRIN-NPC111]|jgi:hypothetical protein|nr:hypothetical protein [Aphanothece sp. CMT-3BRIN-NPC111]